MADFQIFHPCDKLYINLLSLIASIITEDIKYH